MSLTPCATCPWRKSSTVGGVDIPNFDIQLMRNLACTVGEGDERRQVMACHYAACGAETPCIGYVCIEGYSNINVRLMALRGEIDLPAIVLASKDIELWSSFHAMLAAYEDAAEVSE